MDGFTRLNGDPFWSGWSEDRGAKLDHDIRLIGKFVRLNGRFPSHSAEDLAESRLAYRIYNFRQMFKNGTLSSARTRACEAIRGWRWTIDRSALRDREIRLIAEFAKLNDKLPADRFMYPDESLLGRKVSNLRQAFKQRKLSQEHIRACEDIPGWVWVVDFNASRDRDIQLINEFAKLNNKMPSSRAKAPEERRIGKQVSKLRQAFKQRKLSQERIRACEDVPGWVWSAATPVALITVSHQGSP